MDSMPPLTTMSWLPALIMSWQNMVARMPEPHSLLMVVAPVLSGRPARRMAWRAGPCLRPAGSTQPITTSSTSAACRPARATASRIQAPPSCGALIGASEPWKLPMAVRAPLRITMLFSDMLLLRFQRSLESCRELRSLSRARPAPTVVKNGRIVLEITVLVPK